MPKLTDMIIPVVLCLILIIGLARRVEVFDEFVAGAKDGLSVSFGILPSLILLMTAVGMFKASGALDVITHALGPVADFLHIPKDVVPLAILRPISGSGSLAFYENMLTTYGPDSFIGRVASVMQGSTETTFYTIAVYYGAAKVSKTRHTLPCAMTADVVGFIMSATAVRLFFS